MELVKGKGKKIGKEEDREVRWGRRKR